MVSYQDFDDLAAGSTQIRDLDLSAACLLDSSMDNYLTTETRINGDGYKNNYLPEVEGNLHKVSCSLGL